MTKLQQYLYRQQVSIYNIAMMYMYATYSSLIIFHFMPPAVATFMDNSTADIGGVVYTIIIVIPHLVPYSQKYWRELHVYSADGPQIAIAKILASLNSAVQ